MGVREDSAGAVRSEDLAVDSVASVLTEFDRRRAVRLEARVKIREFADVLRSYVADKTVHDLAAQILGSFEDYAQKKLGGPSRSATLAETLRRFASNPRSQESLGEICFDIDEVVKLLDFLWQNIARTYADLALRLTIPRKYWIR